MPTPAERQALLFVAAVAALGVGFRGCRALRSEGASAAAEVSLATQLRQVDSAITSGGVARARRTVPPAGGRPEPAARGRSAPASPVRPGLRPRAEPGEDSGADLANSLSGKPTDLDVAGVEELDRLPGIGPALASRIVADREAKGPFGSLKELQRVKGVGPVLAAKLHPHVTFSLSPRLDLTEMPAAGRGRSP
ncbi:MAG: ComEA family DNA-binding protein [Gemmatimonadaceae bacterium]